MAGTEIAKLFATVGADASGFNDAMDSVKNKLSFAEKGFGGLQSAIGTGLKMAAGVGVAAIGAVTAGMGHAVVQAGNLEQQAANISAVFGAMAPPVEDVKGLINELALDPNLIIGIDEAGAGLQMMAQNGLAWEDIAGGVARSTILLANATGTDLATSVDIATNAMGIFELGVEDMDSVVATFTNAANKSQFGVEDWGYALSNAGPKAAAFGFELDDLFAAMTMTSSGFSSGMQMGTSWAWMINGLVPNTEKAAAVMQELGLITADGANQFFNADGTGKSLTEVIKILQGAFSGLSAEQQMSTSRTIFGQEAFGALSGVLNMNNDELSKLIPQMTDFSAVEAGAETRTNTFQAAMTALHDTVNAVFVMVGDKFLPVLTTMARTFADFVKTNAPAVVEFFGAFSDRFTAAIPVFERGIFVFEDGAGILMSFLEVMGMSGDKAQEVGKIFWNFKEKLEAFFAPIAELISRFFSWNDVLMALGAVVASIVIPALASVLAAITPIIAAAAAIISAIALLRNAWENDWLGIRSAVTYAWDIISGVFDSVMIKVNWIVDTFRTQWDILTRTNATLGEKISLVWNTMLELAHTVWQGIVTTVQILWPKFVEAVTAWGKAAWEWISTAAPIALDNIKKWGTGLWEWVTANAPKWVATLAEWGEAAWQWIVEIVPIALTKLGEWGGALLRWLGNKLPGWIAMLLEWGTALYEWIGNVIPKAIQSLADFIHGLREKGEGEGTSTFVRMVGEWATKFWRWIVDDLIPAVGPAFTKFIGAMSKYGYDLSVAIGNLAKELGLLLWEWIVEITPIALRKLGEWGSALWGWIKENAPVWLQKLGEWATIAWEWIVEMIPVALRKLGEWGAALWGWIKENAPIWAEKIDEWAVMLWAWIIDVAWPATKTSIVEWATNLWDWIKENAPKWWEQMKKVGEEWINKFRDGIEIAWINFTRWFLGTPIGDFIGNILQMLNVKMTPAYGIFEHHGEQIAYSLRQGVAKRRSELGIAGADMGNAISAGLEYNMEMHSPSQVMMRFGGNIVSSLATGMSQSSDLVRGVMDALTGSIRSQAEVVLGEFGLLSTRATQAISNMTTAVTKSLNDAAPQLDNYYKKLLDAKIAAMQLASQPTLPTYIAPPVTAPPVLADPNAGTGGMAMVIPATSTPGNDNYGFKDLSLALNSLTGILDVSDTISDIQTFAAKANMFFTAPGAEPLQGSSAANLAIQSLTSGGVGSLSVNNLLASIQELIREIRERGIGSKFNITSAPDASLQQQTELEELVSYLNALYG